MTDGRTDGRTDGGDCNIPNAFLKKRGDNKCFLAEEVKRSTVHTGFINLIYMNPP